MPKHCNSCSTHKAGRYIARYLSHGLLDYFEYHFEVGLAGRDRMSRPGAEDNRLTPSVDWHLENQETTSTIHPATRQEQCLVTVAKYPPSSPSHPRMALAALGRCGSDQEDPYGGGSAWEGV